MKSFYIIPSLPEKSFFVIPLLPIEKLLCHPITSWEVFKYGPITCWERRLCHAITSCGMLLRIPKTTPWMFMVSLILPSAWTFLFIKYNKKSNWNKHILHSFSATSTRELDWFNKVKVFVLFTGRTFFKIRSDFTTTCSLRMAFFPFDQQTCNIDAGLQEFSSYQVNLTNGNFFEIHFKIDIPAEYIV